MIEALVNKGIVVVNEDKLSNSGRLVVVGTARGGTSMVAGVLQKLGVHMGDQAHHPVYEDVLLSKYFEEDNQKAIEDLASKYNDKHAIWGWKRPSSIKYLPRVDDYLDKPKYIFIFKDILSISHRNSISMLSDTLNSMQVALEGYSSALDFIRLNNPTAMMVSYDKALRNPNYFVDYLCDYLKLSVKDSQKAAAISFIQPEPEDYLDSSRITKSMGFVDQVGERFIKGWAKYVHSDSPAKVNLFVNGVLVDSVTADKYRKDLAEKFSVDCAFQFDLEALGVSSGSDIRVRVENEVVDLRVSQKNAV